MPEWALDVLSGALRFDVSSDDVNRYSWPERVGPVVRQMDAYELEGVAAIAVDGVPHSVVGSRGSTHLAFNAVFVLIGGDHAEVMDWSELPGELVRSLNVDAPGPGIHPENVPRPEGIREEG